MQTRTISSESIANSGLVRTLAREAQAMADESGEVRVWLTEDGSVLDVFVPKVLVPFNGMGFATSKLDR